MLISKINIVIFCVWMIWQLIGVSLLVTVFSVLVEWGGMRSLVQPKSLHCQDGPCGGNLTTVLTLVHPDPRCYDLSSTPIARQQTVLLFSRESTA